MHATESPHYCEGMINALSQDDLPLKYDPVFREYGIAYLDGGSSSQRISHCPFCGSELPSSLRNEWFAELEKLGLEWGDPATPADMRSDEWWKHRNPD